MANSQYQGTGTTKGGAGSRYWRKHGAYFGVIPFFIFTGIFLIYPTWSVITGAFKNDKGAFDTAKIHELLVSKAVHKAFQNSFAITMLVKNILCFVFVTNLCTSGKVSFLYLGKVVCTALPCLVANASSEKSFTLIGNVLHPKIGRAHV